MKQCTYKDGIEMVGGVHVATPSNKLSVLSYLAARKTMERSDKTGVLDVTVH